MGNSRKQYLDIAKGIGIILVVIGHCPQVYNPLKQWIYAFHMPLFFIISGMVWDRVTHEKKGFLNKKFVQDKIRRLIVPCFIWGIAYMILDAVMNHSFTPLNIAYLIYGSQSGFSHAGSLTSLWFLPCMFLSVCLFELVQMHTKKRNSTVLIIISLIFAAVGIFLPRISGGYPWSLDVAFLAVAFMLWGYLGKENIKVPDNMGMITIVSVGLFILLTLTFRINLSYVGINNADLAGRYFGNSGLYLLDALAGSAATILTSMLIEKNSRYLGNGLAYLGKRTIPIFILHKPVVQIIGKIVAFAEIPTPIVVIGSVIISIALSICLYSFIRRIAPAAFGER